MRWIAVILLVLVAASASQAGYVDLVKNTKNAVGLYCSEIPRVIEKQLGYKTMVAQWMEDKDNSAVSVSLKINAQKEVQTDTVYFSYAWRPEWIWGIEKGTKNVYPLNGKARDWMKGKI